MLHTFVPRQAATTPQRAKSTLERTEHTLQQAALADWPSIASLRNLAALAFPTMTTKPTFRAEFKPGEGGKTAVYMARPPRRICDWINTRGEKGPWSEICSVTVAA